MEARDNEIKKIQQLTRTKQSHIVTVVGGVDLRTGEVFLGVKSSKDYSGNVSCVDD